jgi:hypothetical protein
MDRKRSGPIGVFWARGYHLMAGRGLIGGGVFEVMVLPDHRILEKPQAPVAPVDFLHKYAKNSGYRAYVGNDSFME